MAEDRSDFAEETPQRNRPSTPIPRRRHNSFSPRVKMPPIILNSLHNGESYKITTIVSPHSPINIKDEDESNSNSKIKLDRSSSERSLTHRSRSKTHPSEPITPRNQVTTPRNNLNQSNKDSTSNKDIKSNKDSTKNRGKKFSKDSQSGELNELEEINWLRTSSNPESSLNQSDYFRTVSQIIRENSQRQSRELSVDHLKLDLDKRQQLTQRLIQLKGVALSIKELHYKMKKQYEDVAKQSKQRICQNCQRMVSKTLVETEKTFHPNRCQKTDLLQYLSEAEIPY